MSERQSTSKKPERRIQAVAIPHLIGSAAVKQELELNDLDAYRRLIGGGYLQVVGLTTPAASLYCDEDGKVKDLPMNTRATAALWMWNTAFRFRDDIRGDAFLVGPPDRHGNDTSVPTDLAELLTSDRGKVVEAQRIVTGRWVPHEPAFDDFLDAAVYAMEMSTETGVNDVRLRLAEEQGQRAGDV